MNKQRTYRRIRSVGRALRWITFAGVVGIVTITALHWLSDATERSFAPGVHMRFQPSTGSSLDPPLARWLDLLPTAMLLYGLYRLTRILRAFEQGEFLSAEVATHLQWFSAAIAAFELLDITLPLQIAAIHAFTGRYGEIQLEITGGQVGLLVLAALFTVLAWVLHEAARVAEDHSRIV
jgi:hypothetical protein